MPSPYERNDEDHDPLADHKMHPPEPKLRTLSLAITIIALTAVSVIYRLLHQFDLNTSAVLYIGIPAILALLVANTPSTKSATGTILKSITILLLLTAILMIEGVLCILMSAPIFYAVGLVIGLIIDWAGKYRKTGRMQLNLSIFFAMLSLEGVHHVTSFQRRETVVITKNINADINRVSAMMHRGPTFDQEKTPLFLKMGFPHPKKTEPMSGHWQLTFPGMYGENTYLTVKEKWIGSNEVIYKKVGDSTKIGEWLEWNRVHWDLQKIDTQNTQVTMTLQYKRKLDPAWYFGPIQRYGVTRAGEYFFDCLFHQITNDDQTDYVE